ncbi:MAG: putative transcriptional regulator, PucR family [Streptosporangiaceae bacterium]|nr:putative transcriptional regulator, PucR family [Streptosporangiaceae bacterium]
MTDLRLVLRSGGDALDRPVRWVYTTELVLPGRYLSGDELVLTGLMWRGGHEDPDRLVSTLVEAGVSALGVGTAVHGVVPYGIVAACLRHGLPLIEVPAEVSFGTVSELVTRRLMAEGTGAPGTSPGRRHRLLSAVAGGAGLETVVSVARQDLGRGCWVLSPTGRIIAGGQDGLPDGRAHALAAEFLRAARLPHVSRTGPGYTLLPAGTRTGHRVAGWFLACEGVLTEVAEHVRESAYELAELAALERARVEEGRRVQRRLVAELADLTDPAEAASRMRACGLAPADPYVAVSATVAGVDRPDQVGCAVLDELLCGALEAAGAGGAESGAAIGVAGAEAVALVPDPGGQGAPALVARMRAGARRLEPGLRGQQLTIGVSGPAQGPAALRGAFDEARHTRRLGALRPGPVHLLTGDDVDSYALLLAAVPAAVRRSFRERLLGPLRRYDTQHHSDLVHTLEIFLDCSGSWSRCAARLHVHVNTLRYRVHRIEELTGRDLGNLEDRVDLFLALRAT